MLLWRCVTSRCHINLNATLNRRWNVRWVWVFINRFQEMQYNVGTHYFILLLWKCVDWLRHFLQFYDLNINVFNFLKKISTHKLNKTCSFSENYIENDRYPYQIFRFITGERSDGKWLLSKTTISRLIAFIYIIELKLRKNQLHVTLYPPLYQIKTKWETQSRRKPVKHLMI